MKNINSPVYPTFVLQNRQLLADMYDHIFHLPELEAAKSLKPGDFAAVVGYIQNYEDDSGRWESTWLRVEVALPEYRVFIGRIISPVFVETIFDSKIEYLPFFPENVAEIFTKDCESRTNSQLEELLEG